MHHQRTLENQTHETKLVSIAVWGQISSQFRQMVPYALFRQENNKQINKSKLTCSRLLTYHRQIPIYGLQLLPFMRRNINSVKQSILKKLFSSRRIIIATNNFQTISTLSKYFYQNIHTQLLTNVISKTITRNKFNRFQWQKFCSNHYEITCPIRRRTSFLIAASSLLS